MRETQSGLLVVEGDDMLRNVLVDLATSLEVPEDQIDDTDNIRDGERIYLEKHHQLVILALSFPGAPYSGRRLLQTINQDPIGREHTSVYMFTSHQYHSLLDEGAKGYLDKPFQLKDLEKIINPLSKAA